MRVIQPFQETGTKRFSPPGSAEAARLTLRSLSGSFERYCCAEVARALPHVRFHTILSDSINFSAFLPAAATPAAERCALVEVDQSG